MIDTKSVFYYMDEVTTENFYLDFNEGAGDLFAEIDSGEYTPTDLAIAVQSALNDAGTLTYTVTFNRTLKSFTISASANFSLLITNGTHVGNDIFPLLGFTGPDLSGDDSYTGGVAVYEYKPQFKLQDFISPEDLQKAISPSVNKSASGEIEVVRFGVEKFYEFNIMFITDIEQAYGSVIESNATGVSDARQFMRFCITKNKLEFMEDRSDRDTFVTIMLESTEEDSKGTGYRLKEMYTNNLPYYYSTGKLVFRLVE